MEELQKNSKLILGLAYMIGGLFLLIYFWHVGYFPTRIKLEDLLFVSLLSCVGGILFITIIILTLLFPVINYQSCHKLIQFEKILKYKYIKNNKNKPKIQSFIGSILDGCIKKLPVKDRYIPQLFLVSLPLFIFIVLSVSLIYLVNYEKISGNLGFIILILLTLIAIIVIFRKSFIGVFPNTEVKSMFKSKIFYIYLKKIIFSIFLVSFSFVISFPIMSNSPELQQDSLSLAIYLVIFMMSFILFNIIEQNFLKRVTFNLLILFTFLFITKTFYIIPSIILKEFNLAQVKVNQISIDGKGCKIINPDSNSSQCIEKNIKLVWNVGGLYVFDKPLDSNFTTFERYEIPQEFILSRQQTF